MAESALFLMHSFNAIKLLLISLVYKSNALSWNYESAVFSDPARSNRKSSPMSISVKLVFLNWILHMAWLLLDVSFLNVDTVVRFLAACSFKAKKCSGDSTFTWVKSGISSVRNLSSPILNGFRLFSRSDASFPRSWKKETKISYCWSIGWRENISYAILVWIP